MSLHPKKPQTTIGVFRALKLGDMLVSVPALRALRTAYPEAKISLIGLPWAEVFARRFAHYIDTFFPFPGYPGLPEQEVKGERIPPFLREMQAQQFDVLIQLHGAGQITNPLLALFRAREFAGYYVPGQFRPGKQSYPYPAAEREVGKWITLLTRLGIPSQGDHLEFPLFSADERAWKRLKERFGLQGPFICLHPGAADMNRRWNPGYFARVGDALAEWGYTIVITGSAGERAVAAAVQAMMKRQSINLAGETELGTLAAMLTHSSLLVTNDTGVSHLADALRTSSVIIYLTTSPEIWGPADTSRHIPVLANETTVAAVTAAAMHLLPERNPSLTGGWL